MKNKILPVFLSLILMSCIITSNVSATALPNSTMNIKVRIEGISQNYYNQTIAIPYSTNLSVKDALLYADSQSADINISITAGTYGNYISDINGDAAGTFGGYDGWLYNVNSIEPVSGIDGYNLAEGDSLLLYYGDPYGAGMQFPIVDDSKISQGIIKFTSSDTTYDESYNPTVTINPIKDATVTWYYNDTSTNYTTNANGEVTIPQSQLILGQHRIQIEKYGMTAVSGKYLPLVLRLSQSASVNVSTINTPTPTPIASISPTAPVVAVNAQTGDSSVALIILMMILSLATLVMLISKKGKEATM